MLKGGGTDWTAACHCRIVATKQPQARGRYDHDIWSCGIVTSDKGPVQMDDHDQTDRMLDQTLRDLLAGIAHEPVSDELRDLALRLQKLLDDRRAVATAKG